jgi:radical SAM-linked protein
VSLSVASLRAYGLADDLLDDMRRVRAAGLTFAPEAGTQRMRDVVNKNVTEEQLMDTAERVFSRGFDKMKLYFMIGLPTETDDDVRGIVSVGRNALAIGKKHAGGRARVTVSVSTHVPKPHTPFQWAAMDSFEEIERKQAILRHEAQRPRNLTLRTHGSKTSVLEGILARGDRRLGPVIERAYQHGAYFDSWEEHFDGEIWREAMEYFGVDKQQYLGTLPVDARLPWDHFDVGLEEGFLRREYRKALSSRLSPPCGKAKGMFVHHTNTSDASSDQRRLVCYDCGIACDLGEMRQERLRFLDAMGAAEPGQRARLPMLGDDSTDPNLPAPERYRPPREGGEPERWRLGFQKLGATALVGHLDLLRELPRVIRRAGIKTHYSRGFKPKPEISFGPALALGVASLGELLDVQLLSAPDAAELLDRLNRAAGPGLRFTRARRVLPGEPRLNTRIKRARYWIALANAEVRDFGGIDALQTRVAEFMASSESKVVRRVKGISRMIDVRSHVLSLRIDETNEVPSAAGLVGRMTGLDVVVSVDPSGSVKQSEIVRAILQRDDVPHRAIRMALLGADDDPFEALPKPTVAKTKAQAVAARAR